MEVGPRYKLLSLLTLLTLLTRLTRLTLLTWFTLLTLFILLKLLYTVKISISMYACILLESFEKWSVQTGTFFGPHFCFLMDAKTSWYDLN